MALEFLTKKKWNPANAKNREQVRLREQALEKDKNKMAELQKQLQEERKQNELRRLQNGDTAEEDVSRRKVDWIYEKPLNDTKSSEDYLTGKAVFDLYKNEKNAMRELEEKKVAGSTFIDDDDISNPNELRRRVNEDPLMLMRKKEMEVTKNRLSNPQRIMKIAAMLQAKGSDIRLDFNDMKTPEEYDGSRASFKKGIQKAVSDSDSDSDNYTTQLKRKQQPKSALVKRTHRSESSRSSSPRPSSHRHHRRNRSVSRSSSPRPSLSRRNRSVSRSSSLRPSLSRRNRSVSRSSSLRPSSRRNRSVSRSSSLRPSSRRNRSVSHSSSRRPSHHHNRSVSRSRSSHHHNRSVSRSSSPRPSHHHRHHRSHHHSRSRRTRYNRSPSSSPHRSTHSHPHSSSSHTQARQSRTTKLSSAQIEEKLRQMQQDAVTEEDERKRRLAEEEKRAEEEQRKGQNVAPVFLSKMNRDAYKEDTMSYSQRISSRRNFQMKHVD